jgi:hypothetical protein
MWQRLLLWVGMLNFHGLRVTWNRVQGVRHRLGGGRAACCGTNATATLPLLVLLLLLVCVVVNRKPL